MKLPRTYSKNNNLHVIIETPSKSRNKFNYDPNTGLFKLKKVMPLGLEFPCDMGFIPGTKGEDGNPLDALIIMDDITYPGCLVECRLIGVIKANQKNKGKNIYRNDRFLMIPAKAQEYSHIHELEDLNQHKVDSIVKFFINYNAQEGKEFVFLGFSKKSKAHSLVKKFKL